MTFVDLRNPLKHPGFRGNKDFPSLRSGRARGLFVTELLSNIYSEVTTQWSNARRLAAAANYLKVRRLTFKPKIRP